MHGWGIQIETACSTVGDLGDQEKFKKYSNQPNTKLLQNSLDLNEVRRRQTLPRLNKVTTGLAD